MPRGARKSRWKRTIRRRAGPEATLPPIGVNGGFTLTPSLAEYRKPTTRGAFLATMEEIVPRAEWP